MTGAEHIFYFHGMPGGPGELKLFGSGTAAQTAGFQAIDRNCDRTSARSDTYFEQLAANIRRQVPDAPLRLIGFSLGASAALRTARHLGEQVRHIDLVSAAVPLSLGSYLENMAGAPVFKLAKLSTLLFRLAAQMQSVAARLAPGRLYAMLFASAQGGDRELAADPAFKASMLRILQHCLRDGLPAYRREIELYVHDWSAELDQITQPVSIFHGQADNWSPAAMAGDLARRLPRCEGLNLFDDMSHYSTLREFLLSR